MGSVVSVGAAKVQSSSSTCDESTQKIARTMNRVSLLTRGGQTNNGNMAKIRTTNMGYSDGVLERPAANSNNCWPYFHARIIKEVVAQ